jgi:hypothetical protein
VGSANLSGATARITTNCVTPQDVLSFTKPERDFRCLPGGQLPDDLDGQFFAGQLPNGAPKRKVQQHLGQSDCSGTDGDGSATTAR